MFPNKAGSQKIQCTRMTVSSGGFKVMLRTSGKRISSDKPVALSHDVVPTFLKSKLQGCPLTPRPKSLATTHLRPLTRPQLHQWLQFLQQLKSLPTHPLSCSLFWRISPLGFTPDGVYMMNMPRISKCSPHRLYESFLLFRKVVIIT